MAIEDFVSLAGIIGTLISAIIVWIILIIVNKIIAHNVGAKRAFILAFVALFITPIAASFIATAVALPALVAIYVIPLIVWIILGEALLKGGTVKQKLKVIVVAFVVYIILTMIGVQSMIAQFMPAIG